MNRDRDRDRDKTDTTRARAREREQRNGGPDRDRKHSRERSISPKRVWPARDGERERDANQESAIHARERERAGWGGQESSRGKRERSRDELDKIRDWSLDRDRGKSDKGRAEIDRERYRGKQRDQDRGKVGNAGGKKEGCRDRERVGNSDHSLAKSLGRPNFARAGGRGSSRGREGRREREKEEKTRGNGGVEVGKGRETDRYSERDSNRDRQRGRERDRERDRDREREYTQAQRPSKQFKHVNKLNQQPSNSSGTMCSSHLIATQIKCELHNKNRGTVNLMREPNPTTHGTTMRWVCKPGKECKGPDGRTAEVIFPHITQIKCEVHNKNRSAANLMQEKNPHTQVLSLLLSLLTTQFTCFTRTKVQILTPEELLFLRGPLCDGFAGRDWNARAPQLCVNPWSSVLGGQTAPRRVAKVFPTNNSSTIMPTAQNHRQEQSLTT